MSRKVKLLLVYYIKTRVLFVIAGASRISFLYPEKDNCFFSNIVLFGGNIIELAREKAQSSSDK